MIIVVALVGIILFIIGLFLVRRANKKERYSADAEYVPVVIGCIVFAACIIAAFVLTHELKMLNVIDDKIAMYEEENTKIETQIAEAVKQYQEYEHDIFVEVAPESAVTLVSLYPELKADTLVQKQIEVYIANNEKIKELKESKISGSVMKWWLYFGG